MKTQLKTLVAGLSIAFATAAQAVPQLQLDILNGTYDSTTQTVIAGSNPFKLYAYLTPKGNPTTAEINALLADTYYLSMAVVPQTGPTGASLGSFTYNSSTINVTADMTYGTPPLETVMTQLSDPGDLGSHSIYETFYAQRSFQFVAGQQSLPYDTQTSTGQGPQAGSGMYYMSFDIDVTNLTAGTAIHFDLYSSAVVTCNNNPNCVPGDVDVNDFAPFSHDAQSGSSSSSTGGGGGSGGIPEPGTLSLFGAAILGGFFYSRRRQQPQA